MTRKFMKRFIFFVNFAVPADHRIKLKECEKRDKYLDLARELKKLWNMKVTVIPIVIGAFDTVTKGLLKGLEDLEVGGRVETIRTTALFKTARILRRVLETWEEFLSLNRQWKTISLRRCEKLLWVIIIIVIEVSWRLEETCCHSNSREKPSTKTDMKNSQGVNNNKN